MSVPVKDHSLFSSKDFEALPLSQGFLDEWSQHERHLAGKKYTQRETIIAAWQACKARAWQIFNNNTYKTFATRQECRISWELLHTLEDPIPFHHNHILQVNPTLTDDHPHNTFFTLPTQECSEFKIANYNRLVLAIEVLTARLRATSTSMPGPERDAQISNAAMNSILCRWLRNICKDEHPSMRSCLWKKTYRDKSDEATFYGLNFEQSFKDFGIGSLPPSIVNFDQLLIRAEVQNSTTFVFNSARSRFRNKAKQRLGDGISNVLDYARRLCDSILNDVRLGDEHGTWFILA